MVICLSFNLTILHNSKIIISEAMRLHSPVPILLRKATADYTIPNTKMKIEKGTQIIISNDVFHKDPKYFPNPEKFDPDRLAR